MTAAAVLSSVVSWPGLVLYVDVFKNERKLNFVTSLKLLFFSQFHLCTSLFLLIVNFMASAFVAR